MQLLNVKKVYHNKMTEVLALDHVSLCLNEKGMTFIIGPSGCGKTTLLNIMAGRDHNYEGNVIVDGNVEYLTQKKCRACEMESFALFYNAYKLGCNAACILTISDNILTKEETTAEERQNSFTKMVELALEASLDL